MATTPEVVFAGTNGGAVTDIGAYEAAGGFKALAKARALTPDEVIEELNGSQLRGRGGAFFPTGRKWSFLPKPEQLAKPHYLVVNADESEPGTFKDREIMLRVPFRFLEGCLIAAHAIQSQHVFIYIRGEYEEEFEVLRDSLAAMRKQKLLGERHVRAPPRRRRVHLRRGDGAARVPRGTTRPAAHEAAVPGDRGPVRGTDRGQQRRVDHHRDLRPRARRRRRTPKLGVPNSTGTRVFSLSGNVVNGGNYELPHGFPLKDLIYEVGGGIAGGRTLKAVIPGGSSTVVLTADGGRGRDPRLRLAHVARHGDRLGRRDRDRRPLLHGAARDPRLAVLRARVVRQVHALPRRHALADADPREDRGRAGGAGGLRPAARRLRPDPRQVPVPARRLRRDRRRELRGQVPRRVPGAHRSAAAARSAAASSLEGDPRARRDARPRRPRRAVHA